MQKYDALALFSGGLDSILAMRVVQEQGLRVLGLHFVSPFFGYPERIPFWTENFGVNVTAVDISEEYVRRVLLDPSRGFGKFVNPCIDCHAFMARKAFELLPEHGAAFVISGEVLGQRPMSQRRDSMDAVAKDAASGGAEYKGLLVRPLCAKHLEPTRPELDGLLDRSRLRAFKGRGRKEQLAYARELGFDEQKLPTPAGGCKLTEAQPAARYLKLLTANQKPTASDFHLIGHGRTYWSGDHWLTIGRNQADNEHLKTFLGPDDLVFDLRDFPSPLTVGRQFPGTPWSADVIADAASFAASFSPKARQAFEQTGNPVAMRVLSPGGEIIVQVVPARETPLAWAEPLWKDLGEEKKALAQA